MKKIEEQEKLFLLPFSFYFSFSRFLSANELLTMMQIVQKIKKKFEIGNFLCESYNEALFEEAHQNVEHNNYKAANDENY